MTFILALAILQFLGMSVQGGTHIAEAGGGKPTEPHQYPWMVSLRVNSFVAEHLCGGSLIQIPDNEKESDIVLTAAHCVTDPWSNHSDYWPEGAYKVVIGNHFQNESDAGEEIRKVNRVQYYPKWNYNKLSKLRFNHDIAIIKLASPVKFSDTIQPIALPKKGELLAEGTECIIAGWGYINNHTNHTELYNENILEGESPNELYHMNVSIQNNADCMEILGLLFNQSNMYCIGPANSKSSACGGDSGGPLFLKKSEKWVLHGITSFWFPPCGGDTSLPSGYTNVEPYLDWISDKIQEWRSPVLPKSE